MGRVKDLMKKVFRGKRNETTSPEVASIASKGIRHPEELTRREVQSLAGTALTQAEARKRKRKRKARSKKVMTDDQR